MFNQIIDQFYRARQHAKCDIDIPIYVSPTRRGTILCLNERSYRQFFDHVVETSLGFTPVFLRHVIVRKFHGNPSAGA